MSPFLVVALVCAFLTGVTVGAWLSELSHHDPRRMK
jgi:hypothetical protein